jgi:ABC-type Fe3+ transport system permease subunit
MRLIAAVIFITLLTLAFWVIIARYWAACDIGINASSNSFTLMLISPVVFVVCGTVFILISRRYRHRYGMIASTVTLGVIIMGFYASGGCPCTRLQDGSGSPVSAADCLLSSFR